MKKVLKNIIIFGLLCLSAVVFYRTTKNVDLGSHSTAGLALNFNVHPDSNNDSIKESLMETNYKLPPFIGNSFVGFREAIGFKESGSDYFAVNSYGYLGKYQFGKETLKLMGINNTNKFLNNPILQERAFKAYTERNKWVLRRDINNFVGKYINNILITESGILAAAHLVGPTNVKRYLRSYGIEIFEDANNTSIEYYLKKFSGYDTSKIKPNKNPKVL